MGNSIGNMVRSEEPQFDEATGKPLNDAARRMQQESEDPVFDDNTGKPLNPAALRIWEAKLKEEQPQWDPDTGNPLNEAARRKLERQIKSEGRTLRKQLASLERQHATATSSGGSSGGGGGLIRSLRMKLSRRSWADSSSPSGGGRFPSGVRYGVPGADTDTQQLDPTSATAESTRTAVAAQYTQPATSFTSGSPPLPPAVGGSDAIVDEDDDLPVAKPSDVRLIELLHDGGPTQVHRGTYLGRPAAIKVAVGTSTVLGVSATNQGQTQLQELRAEGKLMRKLQHPHVVNFYALGSVTPERKPCLVIELVSRGSFFDVLRLSAEWRSHREAAAASGDSFGSRSRGSFGGRGKRGRNRGANVDPLPLRKRVRVLLDSALGVHYLHSEAQIVHRDLKSQNILLDDKYRAKVTDFGISRLACKQRLTQTSFCGTVAWMAPEILSSEPEYTNKVDVFSFAIVIFEALTGWIPWDGLQIGQIVAAVGLERRRPDMPQPLNRTESELQALAKKCWSHNPRDRPDFHRIIRKLQQIEQIMDDDTFSSNV